MGAGEGGAGTRQRSSWYSMLLAGSSRIRGPMTLLNIINLPNFPSRSRLSGFTQPTREVSTRVSAG
jgi:hypothetical protein